jgi:general secretion pathway protein A
MSLPMMTDVPKSAANGFTGGAMEQRNVTPLAHWGLDRWPFPSICGPAQFYPSGAHDEALARIEYLVEARRRLGVLLGASGLGKSLLLAVAARRLARAGKAALVVDALGVSARELLWQIAAGLNLAPQADADAPRLWRQIADGIIENRWQGIDTVLFVDDAGQAGGDVIVQLTRLARLDPTPGARWTLVLAAEAGQAARWDSSLRELVDLRIDLEPWEREDTIGYVQWALVEAGSMGPLFDDRALATLHELAGGVPRQVTRLADFALLAGAAAAADRVDAELVRAAAEEVAWPAPVAAAANY